MGLEVKTEIPAHLCRYGPGLRPLPHECFSYAMDDVESTVFQLLIIGFSCSSFSGAAFGRSARNDIACQRVRKGALLIVTTHAGRGGAGCRADLPGLLLQHLPGGSMHIVSRPELLLLAELVITVRYRGSRSIDLLCGGTGRRCLIWG